MPYPSKLVPWSPRVLAYMPHSPLLVSTSLPVGSSDSTAVASASLWIIIKCGFTAWVSIRGNLWVFLLQQQALKGRNAFLAAAAPPHAAESFCLTQILTQTWQRALPSKQPLEMARPQAGLPEEGLSKVAKLTKTGNLKLLSWQRRKPTWR